MPLAPGLSVYIDDGHTRRMVTRRCSGLRFTKVAPGGHQELQCHLDLPHGMFPRLGPNDLISVTDQRTARTIFDGYAKNPTPVDGRSGQSYDLTALGGKWRAADESRPLIYITRDMGGWIPAPGLAASASVETGQWSPGNPAQRVRTQFAGGAVLATGTVARADNIAFEDTDTEIAGYQFATLLSAKNDAGYTLDILTALGTVVSGAMQTVGVASSNYLATGAGRLSVQLRRSGAAVNVADDTTATDWVDWSGIGRRVDRYGTALTGGALVSVTEVLASQVVEDLLGRLLTMCDPATAVIEATTFGIDQLAYADGARANDVLTHLMVWEYDYLWEILERLPNGLHRFGWRAWPTSPRYVVSTADGWVQKGSDADVCNRVLVTWPDQSGKTQSLTVTAQDLLDEGLVTEADLDGVGDGLTAGQIRDAEPFNIADGKGSASNAARIGRAVLLDTITPPIAGTATVRRPILDLLTGNMVTPWELEPGYVCRVQEKGYDLRITQADYDHDDQAMQLTLGTPVLTAEQRLARLDAA